MLKWCGTLAVIGFGCSGSHGPTAPIASPAVVSIAPAASRSAEAAPKAPQAPPFEGCREARLPARVLEAPVCSGDACAIEVRVVIENCAHEPVTLESMTTH